MRPKASTESKNFSIDDVYGISDRNFETGDFETFSIQKASELCLYGIGPGSDPRFLDVVGQALHGTRFQ